MNPQSFSRDIGHFPFNQLSFPLKSMTLKSVHIITCLELLKVSRDLRHFILFYGPLPRKILEFKLKFTPFTKGPLKGLTRRVRVEILGIYQIFLCFARANHYRITYGPLLEPAKVYSPLHKGFSRLIRGVKGCEKLFLDLDSGNYSLSEKIPEGVQVLYEIRRFLANLSEVREMYLSVSFNRLENWQLVFPNLSPVVSDLMWFSERLDDLVESKPEYEEFLKIAFQKQLFTCRQIHFQRPPPMNIMPALEGINVSLIEAESWERTNEFLDYLARHGVPSRNRHAHLSLGILRYHGYPEKLDLAKAHLQGLPGIREIGWDERPWEISSPFANDPDPQSGIIHFENTFIDPNDPNDRWRTIYSFNKNAERFGFFAQNRPINRIE